VAWWRIRVRKKGGGIIYEPHYPMNCPGSLTSLNQVTTSSSTDSHAHTRRHPPRYFTSPKSPTIHGYFYQLPGSCHILTTYSQFPCSNSTVYSLTVRSTSSTLRHFVSRPTDGSFISITGQLSTMPSHYGVQVPPCPGPPPKGPLPAPPR
jgi:hypothetical protein